MSRSPVVDESVRAGLAHYYPGTGVVASVSLQSEIPTARGLKSSSAVSTAFILAVARAAGREPGPLEVGRHAADVGRRTGLSATGAFDDALAGLEPGFVVTDNGRDSVLRRSDIDPAWGVLLYIPPDPHPPSPGLVQAFSRERDAGERAGRAALDGDWATAMRINTELVERTMNYSYRSLRERLVRRGAIASGVSGLGPTLAVIAPTARLPDLAELLPKDRAEKRLVPFCRNSSNGGRPR
jgi:shikimate kinase